MTEQLDAQAARAYEDYAKAEVAAGREKPGEKDQRIWTAAWLAARASAPVSIKQEAPPLPDPFSDVEKFGMAKLAIGHPNIYPGNFVRLEDAMRAIEIDRGRRELHVVKIHKFGKRNSRRHEYEMSDGSIAIMGEQEALLSVAKHTQSLAAKDAVIADLRSALALLREESELTKIAKLIVSKYVGESDEFTLSVGAWLPDKLIPGSLEFVSYLAIPMSDWRRYASCPLSGAQPAAQPA